MSGPQPRPRSSGLPQLITILGSVVGPTTLLTSVLFFFGWSHAYNFFDHFGVNSTLLGLTTRDYLMRALDGLFVPMTVVACVGLLLLWGHLVLQARLATGARRGLLRVMLPLVTAVGLALAATGLLSVFVDLGAPLAVAPMSLASGVLLLVYARHLQRHRTGVTLEGAARPEWVAVAEWAGVFVLVGLSLFWAASDYSAAVGESRARQFVAELPAWPDAVLYSEKSLTLDLRGVREVRCQDPDAAYRFRYDGLKLMFQSGDQYVFVSEAWSRADGVAVLMPRSDSIRLEFLPNSARDAVRPAAC